MKTTELFVEQVLIGLMAMVGVAAVIDAPVSEWMTSLGMIVGGIALLAAAYLLGILLDRFVDSILESLENRRRLLYVKKARENVVVPADEDPFPESQLRLAVLEAKSATNERYEYLKSRMRLTRSIAVLAPGVTLLHMSKVAEVPKAASLAAFAAIYVVAYIFGTTKYDALNKTYELGRNDDGTLKFNEGLDWYKDAVPYLLLVVALCGLILYVRTGEDQIARIGIGGASISVVAAWSWWRISRTYLKFMDDYWTYNDNGLPAL